MGSALPPPPPRKKPTTRVGLVVVLAIAIVAVLIIAAAAFNTPTGSTGVVAGGTSPPPSTTVSPSPKPSRSPKRERPLVVGSFNPRSDLTQGERLTFGVGWLDSPDPQCRVHTYKAPGDKPRGAFLSDCSSWEAGGKDILLFDIGFKNTSKQAVTLVLRNLVLQSRDGRSFAPVNVRSEADSPANFLNETQKLPPGAVWRGWVTFDGRVTSMVPSSLNYIDGKQTLRQTFDGKHSVVLPSG
jgi:hypothetical protein